MAGWTFRSIVRRAGEVLREEGLQALFFRAVGELGYRRAIVIEAGFDHLPADEAGLAPQTFELLEDGGIADYLALVPGANETAARTRLEAGHVCQLGRVDGRAVQSCWLASGPACVDYLGVRVSPAAVN